MENFNLIKKIKGCYKKEHHDNETYNSAIDNVLISTFEGLPLKEKIKLLKLIGIDVEISDKTNNVNVIDTIPADLFANLGKEYREDVHEKIEFIKLRTWFIKAGSIVIITVLSVSLFSGIFLAMSKDPTADKSVIRWFFSVINNMFNVIFVPL